MSTAVNALAWGARSTFALFYVAMLEEFAWGRGPTALGYSLSWLGFVVFAPVAGWLSDRWGARTVVTGGGVILGAALAPTGQVTSLAQYYLCFGVLGAAGIAGMLIPSTTIVTRWFVRSRGTAMGVLSWTGERGGLLPSERVAHRNPGLAQGAGRLRGHRRGCDRLARTLLPRAAGGRGSPGGRRRPKALRGHARHQ